jgi:cysteine desulfurase
VRRVYLDNAATTPLDARVLAAMQPYLQTQFGNASSMHHFGREARAALDEARATLARCIGAAPDEIVFTASGTEANNLALKGVAFANAARGRHIIASAIEHDCVLGSCAWLATQGFDITLLDVDRDGCVDPQALADHLRPDTILVSIMHANNEIGTVQPLDALAEVCRACGVYLHSDACQSFGKLPLDVRRQPVDLLTLNAHKIYGPKGVGALYVRAGVRIDAMQHGGGHERGLRSATENIPGIVGFAAAADLCMQLHEEEIPRLRQWRDEVLRVILDLPGAYVNGHPTQRLPTNINVAFAGREGEGMRLLLLLDDLGFAVSSGSACSAHGGDNPSSHVLTALGHNPVQARGALRVTLGRMTTRADVDAFIAALPAVIQQLPSINSCA